MTIIKTDRHISRPSTIIFFALGAGAVALTWPIIHSTSIRPDQSEQYTIRHSWEVEEIASDSAVAWNAMNSKRFNDYAKKNGWKYDIKFINFVGDIQRKHVSSVIAGEGADIMLATLPEAAYYADRGMIEPLDEYLNDWEDYQSGQIDKAALDSCRGPDGKLLGLTIYGSGPSFYSIRRDWLDNLGLSIPTTFEQARAVWQAFTFDDPDGDNEQNTYGYAMTMETALGQHATWGISPFMIAAGIEYYRLGEDGNIIPMFNTPEAAEVLDLIKTCFKEGLFGDDAMYRKKPPAFLHFSEKKAACSIYKSAACRADLSGHPPPHQTRWSCPDRRWKRQPFDQGPCPIAGPNHRTCNFVNASHKT